MTEELTINFVLMEANRGSNLYDCKREAIAFAVTNKVRVLLKHNDVVFDVDCTQLTNNIRQYDGDII